MISDWTRESTLVLGKGLAADAEDKDGATPLDMAEEEEHEEAAALLKASLA